MQKYKTLEAFLSDLSEDKRSQVETLRDLILKTEPRLEEHIKWNAPSYVSKGEDRITFNLINKRGVVMLVLHMGTTRKEKKNSAPEMLDESGLIDWSSDIRGTLSFNSVEDINSKSMSLKVILKDWLSIPTKV